MSKKNLKGNPPAKVVTVATERGKQELRIEYKQNPEFIEVKTKRVQLVMQPSLYLRTKAAAEEEGLSFNAYIHEVLEKTLPK